MELSAAIIDDLADDRKLIADHINRFFSETERFSCRVTEFASAESFLKAYRKGEFDIIYLDICMGEMNGIQLAERLRMGDDRINIIFMSTTREFVFKTFASAPKGYLCKPYSYEDFAEVTNRTIKVYTEKERFIKITLPHNVLTVPITEIVSVMSNNHNTEIKLLTGQVIRSNMLFKDLEDALSGEERFLLPIRGVLINMDYAVKISNNNIIMQDGSSCPIRQRGSKEITSRFTKYLVERMRRRPDI